MIGTEINNYIITQLIGQGGMAWVYEAVHKTLTNRKVAIKILKKEFVSDINIKERFIKEAEILSSINHKGIVIIHDFVEFNGTFAIIMELLKGITLEEYVKNNGSLNIKIAIDIFYKIAEVFDYAHSKGIIHRDIKPSNIFIEDNKNIKILDFGIAKLVSNEISATQTGTQMGTISYMSPEQIRDSKNIDHKTDIYSLGVVLHFMITGKNYYNSLNLPRYDIMSKIINEKLPSTNNNLLNEIIYKATNKEASKRYNTCAEIEKELTIFLNNNDFEKKTTSNKFNEKSKQLNYIESDDHIKINIFTKKRILMFGGILLVLIIISSIFIIQKNSQTRYLIIKFNNQTIKTLKLNKNDDFQSKFAEYCKDQPEGTYTGIVTNYKQKPIPDIVLAPQVIIPESEVKFKGTFSIEGTDMPEQKFKTEQDAQNYIDIVIKNKKYYNIVIKDLTGAIIIEKNLAKKQGNDNHQDDPNVVDDSTNTDNPIVDDNSNQNTTEPTTPELSFDKNFGNNFKQQKDQNGLLYITNQDNEIKLGPYKKIEDIGNNLFSVQNSDDLWGYINNNAEVIFEPEFTEKVGFTDGIAIVKTDLGKKFIKSDGTELCADLFQEARPFVEGFAAVKQNDKWGFIKPDGTFLVQPEYDKVQDFAGGMAAVNKTNPGWGFINTDGTTLYQCQFTSIISNFSPTQNTAIVARSANNTKILYYIYKDGTFPTRVPN